jgi:hypothetical protein
MDETVFHVGFDVLTAVVMRISVLWDITPCNPVKVTSSVGVMAYSSCNTLVLLWSALQETCKMKL